MEGPEKKVTRLALGVEGGFAVCGGVEYETEEIYSLAVAPGLVLLPLPNDKLPEKVCERICSKSIMSLNPNIIMHGFFVCSY